MNHPIFRVKPKPLLLLIFLLAPLLAFTQDAVNRENQRSGFSLFWGWNRAFYTNSDIHFVGDNYDFTLSDVKAKDRPSPFDFETYFFPVSLSVPQTNWRLGYFLNNNWELSVGQDHMKYVMVQDQSVKINGKIDGSTVGYNGEYNNEDLIVSKTFLTYEHTDGLNYFNFEISYFDQLESWNIKNFPIQISHLGGFGIGPLIPRTASRLFQYEKYDKFNIAGFGTSLKAGLNFEFGRYFFIRTELKAGYINMPWVRTTEFKSDHAEQSFFFLQPDLALGTRFLLKY